MKPAGGLTTSTHVMRRSARRTALEDARVHRVVVLHHTDGLGGFGTSDDTASVPPNMCSSVRSVRGKDGVQPDISVRAAMAGDAIAPAQRSF